MRYQNIYWDVTISTEISQDLLRSHKIYWGLLRSHKIYWDLKRSSDLALYIWHLTFGMPGHLLRQKLILDWHLSAKIGLCPAWYSFFEIVDYRLILIRQNQPLPCLIFIICKSRLYIDIYPPKSASSLPDFHFFE